MIVGYEFVTDVPAFLDALLNIYRLRIFSKVIGIHTSGVVAPFSVQCEHTFSDWPSQFLFEHKPIYPDALAFDFDLRIRRARSQRAFPAFTLWTGALSSGLFDHLFRRFVPASWRAEPSIFEL